MLPSRVHAIVLVSKIHKPTLRALAYARATRPSFLEAHHGRRRPRGDQGAAAEWDRRDIPVPLKVLASPFREITRPVVDYVRSIRSGNPRDLVIVYIPEYVLGRWWEQVLHNQSALRLKGRLLFTPGVMVASVPWQLRSSEGAEDATSTVRSSAPSAGARADGAQPRRHRRRSSRSARSPTAVTASPGTTAGWSSSVTPCPASGSGSPSPRRRRSGSCAATPSRSSSLARPGRAACPYAGPGRCGGCDFQHVALASQRQLKADVVREQIQRLARPRGRGRPSRRSPATTRGSVADPGRVRGGRRRAGRAAPAPVPRDRARRRLPDRRPRSSTAACSTPLDRCTGVDAVAAVQPADAVLVAAPGRTLGRPSSSGSRPPSGRASSGSGPAGSGRSTPGRPDLRRPRPRDAPAGAGGAGARPVCGCGLFAAALADAVGPPGRSSPSRVTGPRSSTGCATPRPGRRSSGAGRVDRVVRPLVRQQIHADLVVLDPPRTGAGRE